MILFKRVGDSFRHIEDREWLLLVLETLGVLVGILLAFELQEWAQQRSEAAKHHQLMERLFEETESDVAVLRDIRSTSDEVAENERDFATKLSAGECPPQDSWAAVVTTNMYPPITVPSGVYDELMGAGGLSSIEDASLRAAIQHFRGYLDLSARQSDLFHSTRAGSGTTLAIEDPRVTVHFDPSADEPEIITYDRAALCNDKAFRNRLIDAVRDHGIILSRHAELTDYAIRMCAKLGRLVGAQCTPAFGGPLTGADAQLAAKAAQESKSQATPMLRLPSRSVSPSAPDAGRARG